MSFNQILRGENSIENIDLLRRSKFPDLNDRNALRFFQHQTMRSQSILDDLKGELFTISQRTQLITNDFVSYFNYIRELIVLNKIRVDYLQDILTRYQSERETALAALEAKIKRAQRKVSYLRNINGFVNWISSEDFINFDLLNTSISSKLNVNLNAQEATLPIADRKKISIKEIVIASGSNCVVGAPNGGRNQTSNLLTDRDESILSAYMFDNSNCRLELDVHLRQEEIVNLISISLPQHSEMRLDNVSDIIVYNLDGTSSSVKDLCASDLKFKEFKNILEFNFIPVKTNLIKFVFKQNKKYYLNNRAVYQIDLNEIAIYRLQFSESGKLESKELNFGNYISISNKIDIFPKSNKNYNTSLSLTSSDQTYSLEVNGTPTLLSDYLPFIKWSFFLERNVTDNLIALEEHFFYEYNSLKQRFFAPQIIEEIESNEAFFREGVKACHLIEGTINNSAQEYVNIGLYPHFNDPGIRLNLDNGNLETSSHSISSSTFNNETQKRVKIIDASYSPNVLEIGEYYYLEMGEFFELSSVKILNEDSEIRDYNVYTDNLEIKGVALGVDKLNLNRKTFKLSDYKNQDQQNSYIFTNDKIVIGSFIFKDGLAEGFVQKDFIDGSKEFKDLSSLNEEFLNSQNVEENDVIFYEPMHEVLENEPAQLFKDGDFVANISFADNVAPSTLNVDAPTIDRATNVLYIKTSEQSFFGGYSIRYVYESLANAAESYFSIDYKTSTLYFNKSVNETKRVSFRSHSVEVKFKLAKYYPVEFQDSFMKFYDPDPVLNLKVNRLQIYLPQVKRSVSISDINNYFSPIIYSLEVSAT